MCGVAWHQVLPSIVAAVAGSGAEVYVDGGISRGTDVFKVMPEPRRCITLE